MSLLDILFWIIVILSAIGTFVPTPYPRLNSASSLVLFVIIGLRLFPLVIR